MNSCAHLPYLTRPAAYPTEQKRDVVSKRACSAEIATYNLEKRSSLQNVGCCLADVILALTIDFSARLCGRPRKSSRYERRSLARYETNITLLQSTMFLTRYDHWTYHPAFSHISYRLCVKMLPTAKRKLKVILNFKPLLIQMYPVELL